MPACAEPGCVSLATHGDRCAVHGIGYRQARPDEELHCGRCDRKFRDGEWYCVHNNVMQHVRKCPAPPQADNATA